MLKETIGENAGAIWNVLDKNGKMNLSILKKETGLNDKDLNMSIGWLAKEEKISFEKKGNQVTLVLK